MANRENILLVGERNTGKTTILKGVVEQMLSTDYHVIVIDSATAHQEKSLSVHFSKQRSVQILDGSAIHDASMKSSPDLTLFDVSRHLENSYQFPPGFKRDQERKQYMLNVQDILDDFVRSWDRRTKSCFVMDEIEINEAIINSITSLNADGCYVFNSLHPHLLKTSIIKNHFKVVATPCEICELF